MYAYFPTPKDFTISWKCLNMAERQYQTIFILKFHQFVPCGKRLTDALMESAELQILSAHMRALASGFISYNKNVIIYIYLVRII